MPRKLIRRLLPDHGKIKRSKTAAFFGGRLQDPDLWHLNRRSVAGGVATGLFAAFVPIPVQMILAMAGAIWLRVNLPVAAAMAWVTNPLTVTPIFFFAFKLGQTALREEPRAFNFELTLDWLLTGLADIWRPLLLGCFLLSTVSATLGYITVRLSWRLHVLRALQRRRERRRARR